MSKKVRGRPKENVAGERYDSNAIPLHQPANSTSLSMTVEQKAQMEQMKAMMKSMGMPVPAGMTPERMMQAMNAAGMGGMMPGMPGMGGMMPGMGGMPGIPPGMEDMEGLAGMMAMDKKEAVIYGTLPRTTNFKKWVTFYPAYIDSSKTNAEGRRIPKVKACDDPIVEEMAEVCRFFKLDHVIEVRW
jgi:signal recognition particle subunit SRP19